MAGKMLLLQYSAVMQGLLRDSLELVKSQSNGRSRYTIKALDEKLSFDKVLARLSSIAR